MKNQDSIKKEKLGRCCQILMRKSDKFKTIGISIVYKLKYDYKAISAYNILAKYLGNCSSKHPGIEQLNKYIETLYGTNIGIKCSCRGNQMTMSFFATLVNPKYVQDSTLLEKVIALLHEIIYEPFMEDERLNEDIFNVCKESSIANTESLKDYNMRYVINKLRETIGENKHAAICAPTIGNRHVLNHFDSKNILKYYERLLKAPFDVYVTGSIQYAPMRKLIKKYFTKKGIVNKTYSVFMPVACKMYEPIVIKKDVSQAKVAIAYQVPILFNNKDHYAVRIARLILSGTLSSKFGKVIREKMGLCYSISSKYSSYYGTFIVTTGVASENISKVVQEVENQIQEVRIGNISEEEMSSAMEAIISDISSIDDTLYGTLDMIKTYNNFGQEFDLVEELNHYKQVSKEDVMRVAKTFSYMTYACLDKR